MHNSSRPTAGLKLPEAAAQQMLDSSDTPAAREINQRLIDRYNAGLSFPPPGGTLPVQRTGGPKKPRQPDQAKPDQIRYATNLLRRLWAHDREVLAELIGQLEKQSRPRISRQIDNLISLLASQPRGLNAALEAHLRDLWSRKMALPGGGRDEKLYQAFVAKLSTMTYDEGRKMAALLRDIADRAAPEPVEVTEGMYRCPDGVVYRVGAVPRKPSQLYVEQVVKLAAPKIVRGKEVGYGHVYVPGAIKRMRPEWQMSADEIAGWSRDHDHCCWCGVALVAGRVCCDKV